MAWTANETAKGTSEFTDKTLEFDQLLTSAEDLDALVQPPGVEPATWAVPLDEFIDVTTRWHGYNRAADGDQFTLSRQLAKRFTTPPIPDHVPERPPWWWGLEQMLERSRFNRQETTEEYVRFVLNDISKPRATVIVYADGSWHTILGGMMHKGADTIEMFLKLTRWFRQWETTARSLAEEA